MVNNRPLHPVNSAILRFASSIGKRVLKPIRVYGSLYTPVHWSPIFAVLFLAVLVVVQFFSLPFSMRTGLPGLAEWGVFALLGVLYALLAGLLPPFLVSVKRKRGYTSAYGWLLVMSVIPLLGLQLSSGGEISLVPTFFVSAGGISVVLLFLWRGIEYIGTHDSDRNAHLDWILHNAVAALLRRNEIAEEEARIVSPIGINRPPLIERLESLGPISRLAVEREMVVEELVQINKRELGLRN